MPVEINASSPCYAGGGWSYIGMLAEADRALKAAPASPGSAPADAGSLEKILSSLYFRQSEFTSSTVARQWMAAPSTLSPAYFLYEQDALHRLRSRQPVFGPGALIYPRPAVPARHWIVARNTAEGRAMVELLDERKGGDARRLRQVQAGRFGIRYTGRGFEGSFRAYVEKSSPDLAKAISPDGLMPDERTGVLAVDPAAGPGSKTVWDYVDGLQCFEDDSKNPGAPAATVSPSGSGGG